MPCRPSASAQVRASAIWPTAAAACESSSFSGPRGSFSTARPSAIAPDDTTRMSRFSLCSCAMSSASEASQSSCTRPAAESTSSDEPTLMTMRRKSVRRGVLRDIGGLARPDLSHKAGELAIMDARPRLALAVAARSPSITLISARSTSGTPAPRRAGQHQRRFLRGALQPRDLLLELLGRERVGLAERDDLRLVGEAMAIGLELVAHGLVVLAGVLAGAVDEMQQHTAALDMAEEAVAEPDAFMRVLDQPGQIGEHELALVDAHDAELRMQRGERIVGDLRLGGADRREEGRLAGIRQSDDAGIGDQLQAQPDGALFAGQSGIGVARRLVGRCLEMRVAEAAIAAFGEHDRLPDLGRGRRAGSRRLPRRSACRPGPS